ncbi:MAG: hypothetical protein OES57_15600, partial [Acidimicrobiia bacterium]|nr:hypothetical protein [Acidimicrobiia bacterium]
AADRGPCFAQPIEGDGVRLRPLRPDDRRALVATGLPDEVPTVPGESVSLVIEWHGLVWSSRTGALQRTWLVVGHVAVTSPPPGSPAPVVVEAAWLAPSVRRTRCMIQCHLTLLDHAFAAGAPSVAVEGLDPGRPADAVIVEAERWPVERARLRVRIDEPVSRGDSRW